MGKKAANIRKRPGAKKTSSEEDSNKKEEKSAQQTPEKTANDEKKQEKKNGALVQFLVDFPLISAAFTVGTVVGLYRFYLLVLLQYPHMVPLLRLRPALTTSDERQLLIVAPQGSGSTQVANTLSSTLGVEIGHETSDATQNFVRDGTVSWFHGIRFLPNDHSLNIEMLCSNFKTYMGFHPSMFGPSVCDKNMEAYKECYTAECHVLLQKEKGCALRGDCPTPFRKTLHMTRHPLRTIESLVMKFCRGTDLNNVTAVPEFMFFMVSMYPHVNWLQQSCVEAVALYVTEYNHMIMDSHPKIGSDGLFQIEETTPCQVAEMAGFLSDDLVVYAPNQDKVRKRCEQQDSQANQKFVKGKNQRNTGVINLEWEDLRGGKYNSKREEGDTEIELKVKELTHKLGYNTIDE